MLFRSLFVNGRLAGEEHEDGEDLRALRRIQAEILPVALTAVHGLQRSEKTGAETCGAAATVIALKSRIARP